MLPLFRLEISDAIKPGERSVEIIHNDQSTKLYAGISRDRMNCLVTIQSHCSHNQGKYVCLLL